MRTGTRCLALLAALAVTLTSAQVTAVTVGELPLSNGPYEVTPPDPSVRTVAQVGRHLVLPAPTSTPEEALAVRVGAAFRWSALTRAIGASLSGGERWLFVFVRDPAGAERVVRFFLNSRLMEPFLFPDTPTLEGDEHVLSLRSKGRTPIIEHQGTTIAPADVATTLDRAFVAVSDLFFPLHETPSKGEFPVWIESQGPVELQDVVEAVSLTQTAGYETALVELDVPH